PLPDNAASMESGGAGGSSGAGGKGGSGGSGGTGGKEGDAAIPDASHHPDASRPDASGQFNCGQILLCSLSCGQDFHCLQQCCPMGSQQACQAAQQLGICAFQNCQSSLGNLPQLLQCLGQHCQQQLANCPGLGF